MTPDLLRPFRDFVRSLSLTALYLTGARPTNQTFLSQELYLVVIVYHLMRTGGMEELTSRLQLC